MKFRMSYEVTPEEYAKATDNALAAVQSVVGVVEKMQSQLHAVSVERLRYQNMEADRDHERWHTEHAEQAKQSARREAWRERTARESIFSEKPPGDPIEMEEVDLGEDSEG